MSTPSGCIRAKTTNMTIEGTTTTSSYSDPSVTYGSPRCHHHLSHDDASTSKAFLGHLQSSDCLSWIMAFLSYRDCLSLGATSLSALVGIQDDLQNRQKRMYQTFLSSSQGNVRRACDGSVVISGGGVDDGGDHATNNYNTIPDGWIVLPTVQNRIQCLNRALSGTHPLCSAVRELQMDINATTEAAAKKGRCCHDISGSNDSITRFDDTTSFEWALDQHRKHCRSHKLHASILSEAIWSCPSKQVEHIYGMSSNDKPCWAASRARHRSLTVPLDRYIGDVLCASVLMGHSVAGIIEGGPNEKSWEATIEHELAIDEIDLSVEEQSDDCTITFLPLNVRVESWYRAWVYLHSTLLRRVPFAPEQLIRLGLALPRQTAPVAAKALSSSVGGAESTLQMPHLPFMGGDKDTLMRKMSLLSNFEPLKVTFNEFGRLGPTFRGRDSIQSHAIFPAGFIACITSFESDSADAPSNDDDSSHDNAVDNAAARAMQLRRWASGEDSVVQWLIEVHGYVGMARPLSVMPPMACFRSIG